MSAWDISPGGVRDVLIRMQAAATPFEGQMTSLNSGLEGAAREAASNLVTGALTGFVEAIQHDLQFVFIRTGASMNAAAQATKAYVDGDLEMAANAQLSMARAVQDPSGVLPGSRQVPR